MCGWGEGRVKRRLFCGEGVAGFVFWGPFRLVLELRAWRG